MPAFKFIDLFAGVGGFHHALSHHLFDGECVLAVEIDEQCQQVYGQAFPDTPIVGDIRSITKNSDGTDATKEQISERVPDHDVLCAGFPCQPFSKSGAQLGTRDKTRGTLFFDIMEIVRAKHPRFLLLENVPNLVGPNHRETWKLIKESIREEGYAVADDPVVLSPHRLREPLGAPQVRDRVFILAHLAGSENLVEPAPLLEKTPDPTWHPSQWRLDGYLHRENPGDAYRLRPVETTWLYAWDSFLRNIPTDYLPGFPIWEHEWKPEPEIPPGAPPWKVDFLVKNSAFYNEFRAYLDEWRLETWDDKGTKVGDFPLSRRKFEWQARTYHPTRDARTLRDLLIHLRPSGIRVKPPTYFPALVAITQTPILGWEWRRITPEEASLLQGIPYNTFREAGMKDAEIYRQLGNAVNVGAVRCAARALFDHSRMPWGAGIEQDDLVLPW